MLDEPTTLPDGTVVELVPMDEIDELDTGERARLISFLGDSIRTHSPGTGVPASDLLADLRSAR